MSRQQFLYGAAKALEGVGMVVVLAGVFMSISLGFEDRGLASMGAELKGLALGGALFIAGVLLERGIRSR